MKPLFRRFLLVGILLLASLRHSIADESRSIAIVASYSHTIEQGKTVGARVAAILRTNNIEPITIIGRGASRVFIAVAPNQAPEARLLLAQASKAEKLELTLLVKKGKDLCFVVTPDSILESKKDQRSE